MRTKLTTICTVVMMLLAMTCAAQATTITVDAGGGADYITIQAAIVSASAGPAPHLERPDFERTDEV